MQFQRLPRILKSRLSTCDHVEFVVYQLQRLVCSQSHRNASFIRIRLLIIEKSLYINAMKNVPFTVSQNLKSVLLQSKLLK